MRSSIDDRHIWLLWLICGGALLVRLWGIGFGLPYVYWIDEYHEVMRALELGSGGFNFARTGKGGFYFLLFFEFGVYFVFLKVTGFVSTLQDFADQFVRDPSVFYLMGRATAAVFGCATVAATYCVARQAYQVSAGLFAGLFLAVNVLHVDLSHRVGVDVPMTLFATLALYSAVRIADGGAKRDYLLGGLFAALATTTKLPGILVLLPLVVAHAFRVSELKLHSKSAIVPREFWLAALVFLVVMAITNPGIFLHFNLLSFYSSPGDEVDDVAGDLVTAAARPNLYVFYLEVLKDSMGWPLIVVSMASVGYAVWRRRSSDVILLAFAVVNYVAIASTSSDVLYYPRYALPIVVVLAILCGRAIAEGVGALPRYRTTVSIGIAVILAAWPLVQAATNTHVLTLPDTRTQAKQWFDAHVPAGSTVLIEGGKIAASRLSVPLADSRESLVRRIAYWQLQEPKQARYLAMVLRVHRGGGFRLELVRVDDIAPFENYVSRGVEYFVVRPDVFLRGRKTVSGSRDLLARLRTDSRVTLVKQFKPAAETNTGPDIEIYKFNSIGEPDGR